ncbi:hypothetical protein SAMN05421504_101672 [Amycolatopsis xylanica]|uniref:CHAT domain-containing protein n=2 Tax=Amycolatopsis xylanica TaxID=589385 RepID=A0A1H2TT10_9PSEU|nr:hypothetical protein SAMN05421504_101672 [Amycolatopsis xylanica]
MLVGLPAPSEPPDRPLPGELAGSCSHGYNCRCVARHFGLDPASYGEVPACALSEGEYRQLLIEASQVQDQAKQLSAQRDAVGAHRAYGRMREIARELDRTDLELAALSDLAVVCYAAGDLRNARQCAEAVLKAFEITVAAIVHFGQYAELRMIEGSREVADRVLVNLSIEEGNTARARELIAGQRARAAFRKAAEPGQYPPELLDPHGADELELRILDVRVLIADGELSAARTALDSILDALSRLAGIGGIRDQVAGLEAMALAERGRIRRAGGEDADADFLRLSARHDGPAAAKFDIEVAEARAVSGDLPGAIEAIVAARDRLGAAGLSGDVADASHALGFLLLLHGHVPQAREQFVHAGQLWKANGDTAGLRRLDVALARCDAAEERWESAYAHTARARESAAASGERLECLRADFLAATVRYAHGQDLPAVLDLLLPVALAAEDYRFRFDSAAARTAWASGVSGPANALLMGLLTQLGEKRLIAEMIERTCAVGSFSGASIDLSGVVPSLSMTEPAAGERLPLAALGAVTASLPLRLAPPPDLRWSPSSAMELDRWLALAAERYGLRREPAEPVPTWPVAEDGRETFVLRYADAGHTYLSWRSSADPDTVHSHPIDARLVGTAREFLAEASPTPHEGESVADAVGRAFAAFSPAGEQRLARSLALNLLPADLITRLRAASSTGRRPLLRVQPSPSLAAVPWGLLALPDRRPDRVLSPGEEGGCFDGDERILDIADVSLLAPAGIARVSPASDGPPVYLLDPRIPGQSAFGELGSVLGKQDVSSPLIRHLDARLAEGPVRPEVTRGLDLVRRTDTDRRLLADLLKEPCSRLVFAGHVSVVSGAHGAQTALHLSCPAGLPGTAAPIGAHRPFTAADLALSEVDTMPARVALIGCASASDFGLAEPFGMLLAAVAAGASVVAATVWALPTSAAAASGDPMADLIIAADTALAGADPVGSLCDWQRDRLARWRAGGGPEVSPVFWAGLTCLDAQTWVR